ncbi:MAG: hypothetical protein AAGU11_04075 [Syntrophobacteraceae bacterium]
MKKAALVLCFLSVMLVIRAHGGTELRMRGGGPAVSAGRQVILSIVPPTAPLTIGDGQASFSIPASMAGLSLVAVGAHVYTSGTGRSPAFRVKKKLLSDGSVVDVLSTIVTIDPGEKDSSTAEIPALIDASAKEVGVGDEIFIDVTQAATGTKGGEIHLLFQ